MATSSKFYHHLDILSGVLRWLNIRERIYLHRCNKELQGTIFNEAKDLNWKIRKSEYLIYTPDLKSAVKQVNYFERQTDLPKIQNATIPSSVAGFDAWSGEALPIEPLPWDLTTIVAFAGDKLQVVHFAENKCTVHEHTFLSPITSFSFNCYDKELAVLTGQKITFFFGDSPNLVQVRELEIQSKPSRGLGRGRLKLAKYYYNYLVAHPLSRIDAKLGTKEAPAFGATRSCSTQDGVIYFDSDYEQSISVALFDVHTKLQHPTPIKIDVAGDPLVTQMRLCTTKSNKLIVVLKIQVHDNTRVVAYDVNEGTLIHQVTCQVQQKTRSFGDIVFSSESDKYLVHTVDDMTEQVNIYDSHNALVVSLRIQSKCAPSAAADSELIDDQDWSEYSHELHPIPHLIGWFDAERIYIYSNLERCNTKIYDVNLKRVIKQFALYSRGTLVNVFKVNTKMCFTQLQCDELNLTLVELDQ